MALKLTLLLALPMIALVAILPTGEAQLGGLGGLVPTIQVQGKLYCTVDGNMRGSQNPPFPNAAINVMSGGNVVSTTITNENGEINYRQAQPLIGDLKAEGYLFVTPPLSTCNASLPSTGRLVSSMSYTGNNVVGGLNITNLVPTGFQLMNI
ncbi:OLC1v1020467C1 [Oldenlandia corymbosa var. corymbosa]|uniref:OLC1v1020467C1 n=1 Tax=Oldenlandia corymbosa var. corymbosa TaxID=529605 RepID=A0AAV1EGT2_OLDCO|nr:OLC1v1020467C1 [Oldenlandia corymbosa var. corymbosa]